MESQVTSQNTEHNLQNNATNNQALKYTSTEKPNIQQYVKYVKYAKPDDIGDAHIISRAGKASAKNRNWYNIKNLINNTLSSVIWDMVSSWEPSHIDKTFFPTSTDTTDTEKAMLEELATRKYN